MTGASSAARRSGRGDQQTASPIADYVSPELLTMLATAARELDRHIGERGRCAGCGGSWPCERSRLADLALAAL
jgi:hypothetical protein